MCMPGSSVYITMIQVASSKTLIYTISPRLYAKCGHGQSVEAHLPYCHSLSQTCKKQTLI